MSPDSSKVEVVVNWPQPKHEAEVRQFLGLASYYCKYIDRFVDMAAPLQQLTQKDTPFQWTQVCEESFQRLKASLTEAPVLAYPQFNKLASTMVLQTDASNVGLGAVLEQDQRVIGYACRTLTKAEAVFGNCVGHETVPPLSVGTYLSTNDRPRLHCSGWVSRRWRASCAAGLWQCKNSALRLCIERDQPMEMLMHCHEEEGQTWKLGMQP